jgi:hypothetical protein
MLVVWCGRVPASQQPLAVAAVPPTTVIFDGKGQAESSA